LTINDNLVKWSRREIMVSTPDQKKRAQRILDAASELLMHYGYDKTTVSDIAKQAGVSKGAIYVHFKSKDDLCASLILREMEKYAERWLELLEADSKGGTIGAMYKNSLYALSSSAFMGAMLRQDGRVLGNYLRKPDNLFRTMREQQPQSDRYMFVKMMQSAGAVREDIDAKVIAHIMDMLAYSLVGMDDVLPQRDRPPIDDIIEGIAAIMDRALAPDGNGNEEAGREIIRQIADAARRQMETT
jgi:AcrR family transcriptional regulator